MDAPTTIPAAQARFMTAQLALFKRFAELEADPTVETATAAFRAVHDLADADKALARLVWPDAAAFVGWQDMRSASTSCITQRIASMAVDVQARASAQVREAAE